LLVVFERFSGGVAGAEDAIGADCIGYEERRFIITGWAVLSVASTDLSFCKEQAEE
jgi:hypothetical protein